jgi:hypothetical protein
LRTSVSPGPTDDIHICFGSQIAAFRRYPFLSAALSLIIYSRRRDGIPRVELEFFFQNFSRIITSRSQSVQLTSIYLVPSKTSKLQNTTQHGRIANNVTAIHGKNAVPQDMLDAQAA